MTSNLIRAGKLAFWLSMGLVVLFLFVLPLLTAWLVKVGQMPPGGFKLLAYIETVQTYLMRGLAAAWLFFLGGCFASFLNVVAWRIPRGRGINGSSMCPFCESKLRFSDNLPIIGWLKNGGRCRTCHAPISPRYLIVEVFLGCVFLLVSSVEILAGGANLPLRKVERLQGFEHLVFSPNWELIQLTVYHLTLLCFLFAFALIRSERLRIPMSIFLAGLIFGIGLPIIWPSMSLVSWHIGVDELMKLDQFSIDQFLTISFGLVGGLACGLLVSWSTFNGELLDRDRRMQSTIEQFNCIDDAVAGMMLIGLFLGWQSAFSVTLLIFVINILANAIVRAPFSRTLNLASRMLLATLIHLLVWRMSSLVSFWPSPTSTSQFMIATVGVLVLVASVIRIVYPPKTVAV